MTVAPVAPVRRASSMLNCRRSPMRTLKAPNRRPIAGTRVPC